MGSFFKRTEVEKKESATTAWTVKAGSSQKEMEVEYASTQLFDIIQKAQLVNRDIVFLCIGSDRYVGDSLGPLVGTMLVEEGIPFEVYGTLEHPVHAFNLKETIKEVNKRFVKPFIISIDACLGEQSQVGDVMIKEGPLVPGQALAKVLPEIGDYHIKGMVNYVDPFPATQFLNDTRLFTVMTIAKTIVDVIKRIPQYKKEL